MIASPNTDVGKTAISALLMIGTKEPQREALYIKPIQTGFPEDSDESFVKRIAPWIHSKTLFTFKRPASPHVCALEENRLITDHELVLKTREAIESRPSTSFTLVETAGGITSPVASGSLVCDAFRPLRLPVVLVGDSKLGGISTTISALESLNSRGYDVPLIILFNDPTYANETIIQKNVKNGTRIAIIPNLPSKDPDALVDSRNLQQYYNENKELATDLVSYLLDNHDSRIMRLEELQDNGAEHVWWPFTQHKTVGKHMVVDSAFKDDYVLFDNKSQKDPFINVFDGAASWWTNGLGHGNHKLASAAAYAAGRYGHVIAAEVVHEPKYQLTSLLLKTAGKGWADRVFYSDNGSTAIEVAVKMALTHSKRKRSGGVKEFQVVSLKGSYHGDTIGAMDISDPSVYNDQVDWYTGKGLWLDVPIYSLKQGKYNLDIPESISASAFEECFDNLDQVFSIERDSSSPSSSIYRSYIIKMFKERVASFGQSGKALGGLVIEPVLMGAGGMLFVDPLFQRELIHIARTPSLWDDTASHHPLPVIFDEVFVGMYRLGKNLPSVSSLLHSTPDISCFAKCLTGGLLPLSATLATADIFQSFQGDSKIQSLLHGHSYTAHPVGCNVAVTAIEEYERIRAEDTSNSSWSVWPYDMVLELSYHVKIERVNALGTVLVIELKSKDGAGYLSTAGADLVKVLRDEGSYARCLGNVLYLMTGQAKNTVDIVKYIAILKKAIQSIS